MVLERDPLHLIGERETTGYEPFDHLISRRRFRVSDSRQEAMRYQRVFVLEMCGVPRVPVFKRKQRGVGRGKGMLQEVTEWCEGRSHSS